MTQLRTRPRLLEGSFDYIQAGQALMYITHGGSTAQWNKSQILILGKDTDTQTQKAQGE